MPDLDPADAVAPAHRRFADECEAAGLTVVWYPSPFGAGPGVRCRRPQDVVEVARATTGRVAFARDGDGYAVYPVE